MNANQCYKHCSIGIQDTTIYIEYWPTVESKAHTALHAVLNMLTTRCVYKLKGKGVFITPQKRLTGHYCHPKEQL